MEAVLLSNRGYTIDELSEIFDVDRDTISNWISRWERYGIEGLRETPKQNRPPKLNEEEQGILLQILRGGKCTQCEGSIARIEGKDGERVEYVHDKKMGKAVQFEMETNEKGIG